MPEITNGNLHALNELLEGIGEELCYLKTTLESSTITAAGIDDDLIPNPSIQIGANIGFISKAIADMNDLLPLSSPEETLSVKSEGDQRGA